MKSLQFLEWFVLKLAVCQYFAWILINMVLTNKLSDYTGLAVDGNASLFYFEFIRKLLTFDQIVSAQYLSVVMLRIFMTATRSSKSEGEENSVRSPPFNNIHIFFHVNNNRDFYIFGNIIFSALSLCFYVFNINQKWICAYFALNVHIYYIFHLYFGT